MFSIAFINIADAEIERLVAVDTLAAQRRASEIPANNPFILSMNIGIAIALLWRFGLSFRAPIPIMEQR